MGCRLVSLHERPAGTVLGEYQYSIELENVDPAQLREWLSTQENVRVFGTFVDIKV